MSTHTEPFACSLPWTVPPEHPAFPGHFPGQPILPGVALVAQALEAAAATVDLAWAQGPITIASAKFLSPLLPGDVCVVMLRAEPMAVVGVAGAVSATSRAAAGQRLRFDIKRGDTVAATGVVER